MAALVLAACSVSISAAQPSASTQVDEAAVAAALRSPEALWAFVTSPETRSVDRFVAALRAFPAEKRMRAEERQSLLDAGLDAYGSAPAPQRCAVARDAAG